MSDFQSAISAAFGSIAELVHLHALAAPHRPALSVSCSKRALTYGELDALMDRIAASLQRDGVNVGESIAICASSSVQYAAVFLGALRAGVAVAPLAPSTTRASLARMIDDSEARILFTDSGATDVVGSAKAGSIPRVALDNADAAKSFDAWLTPVGTRPTAVTPEPSWPFNIIYSSGTTGEPKGIVQAFAMRWSHVRRSVNYRYSPESVTLLSTPLYSNTTLVVFFPTIAFGGHVVVMPKFDATAYLQVAQTHRVTHTMLVPVQYQRLMAHPSFDAHDLSAFQFKFSTSAPFNAALKADVLKRWPGGLIEFYGMTEGGGTVILEAHLHPDKLHTVGRPAEGSDIRLIDDDGIELSRDDLLASGEVVGHSAGMMTGYHGQPARTREAEWFDATGKRFIRTGDIGRFDAEGFLTLLDRKKDMIISGGFNVFPTDLEAILRAHPAVADASVIGVSSEQWGETPIAYVVRKPHDETVAEQLLKWANLQLGKTQRLARVTFIDELPRSAIGKVLKRELRELDASKTGIQKG